MEEGAGGREGGKQTSASLCLRAEHSAHRVKNCKCLPVLLCTIVSYRARNRQEQCSRQALAGGEFYYFETIDLDISEYGSLNAMECYHST